MKQEIEKLIREKKPKYITKDYIIKMLDENFYNDIIEKTSFLQNPKLTERI